MTRLLSLGGGSPNLIFFGCKCEMTRCTRILLVALLGAATGYHIPTSTPVHGLPPPATVVAARPHLPALSIPHRQQARDGGVFPPAAKRVCDAAEVSRATRTARNVANNALSASGGVHERALRFTEGYVNFVFDRPMPVALKLQALHVLQGAMTAGDHFGSMMLHLYFALLRELI